MSGDSPKTTPADPMDTPLPCAVSLPGMVFHKGVPLRTLVNAAIRWKVRLDQIEAERLARLRAEEAAQ